MPQQTPALYRVDPQAITEFGTTTPRLETLLLFWILAAGKTGAGAARVVGRLGLDYAQPRERPLAMVRRLGFERLAAALRACGSGCYNGKARSLYEAAHAGLDLKVVTPAVIRDAVWGVGRKTASCFVLHSRPAARFSGLDTHLLKLLAARGIPEVPRATPSSDRVYDRLEQVVLEMADAAAMTPAEFDLAVWRHYASGGEFPLPVPYRAAAA